MAPTEREGTWKASSRGGHAGQATQPAVRRPIWLGPPEDSFAVLVPLHLVLVRTADLAVVIPGATAYGNGFGFDLAIRRAAANDDAFTLDRTLHWLERKDRRPGSAAHGSAIRRRPEGHQLGHLVGLLRPPELDADPASWAGAGAAWRRGGERVRSQSYWVWPLPPDRPLVFVVEWPALGVPLTQARVDGAMIRQAAAQDEGLWPADPDDD